MAYYVNNGKINSINYKCGYCNKEISSDRGYEVTENEYDRTSIGVIAICHNCENPSYFIHYPKKQIPSPKEGKNIEKLPENIKQIYTEIKNCYSVQSWTSVVLLSRKLLMHIAVEHGAEEDKKFIEYVDYIKNEHLIPKGCSEWLEKIRSRGNHINHTITLQKWKKRKKYLNLSKYFFK